MTREQFVNNGASTLDGGITDSATSATVADGSVFPATGEFRILINSEVMLVTARATNVLTIVRAQDGTTAAAHSNTDVVTAILTSGAIQTYANDAMGLDLDSLGHVTYRKPFRLLDLDGNTLTSSDFTWESMGTSSIADDPGGGMTMTVNETTGGWKVMYKTMPTPPFAVTACFEFGPFMTISASGSAMGLGFRDSVTGELEMIYGVQGGEVVAERLATPNSGGTNVGSGHNAYDSYLTRYWFKAVDDGTNIYFYSSHDGVRWMLVGQDVRDAYLDADQIFFACTTQGGADKIFHIKSFVEHVDDQPLGFEYEVLPVEFLTDVGTTQDISSTTGPNPAAAFLMHAQGDGEVAGTITPNAQVGIGFTDLTGVEYSAAMLSQDGLGTEDARRGRDRRTLMYLQDNDNTLARCDASNVGGDLRLIWNRHFTTGETQGAIAFLGGSRHQTYAHEWSPSQAVVDTADSLTGVGFAPDVLITLSGSNVSIGGFTFAGDAPLGIGFAVRNGNQASVNFLIDNGLATTNMVAYTSDAWSLGIYSGPSTLKGQEVTAWGADGYTWTNRGSGGYTINSTALALKLDKATDASVINLDWPASTGEQTYSFGFKPRFVIMASVYSTALNTDASHDTGICVSFINADAQTCSSCIAADNVSTTECQSLFIEKALKVPTPTAGTLWEADFVEFTDDGMTLDFTTADVLTKAIAIGFK